MRPMRQGLLVGQSFTLRLEPSEAANVIRVANETGGDQVGGWQRLMQLLRDRLTTEHTLELDEYELARVARYCAGTGGFQQALRAVRRAGWASGWQS